MTDSQTPPAEPGGLHLMLKVARGRLGRQTLATLVLRVGVIGLALAVAVVLAQTLGSEGFGAYSLAIAWVQILLVPGMLGMDSLMVRELARLQELEPESSRSYALWGSKTVIATALATAVVGGGLVLAVVTSQGTAVVVVQLIALLLIPIMAMTRVWEASLRGVGRIIMGQLPEAMIVPILVLIGVGLVSISPINLTPAGAVGLRVAASAAAAAVLLLVLVRNLPPGPVTRLSRSQSRMLIRSSFSLGLITTVFLVVTRTDVVMLGAFSDLESVGSYTVASRGSSFVVFPFIGLNVVLAPTIASLHAAGNTRRLQSVLAWGSRGAFLAALLISFGLVVFGSQYLAWFGEGFAGGLAPLRILTASSLLASAAGSTGLVMTMTGHEATAARIVGSAAVLNLLLNLVLIPLFGANGAAIATAVSTNLWTFTLVVWIRRRLRVDPTIAGLTPRSPRPHPEPGPRDE